MRVVLAALLAVAAGVVLALVLGIAAVWINAISVRVRVRVRVLRVQRQSK